MNMKYIQSIDVLLCVFKIGHWTQFQLVHGGIPTPTSISQQSPNIQLNTERSTWRQHHIPQVMVSVPKTTLLFRCQSQAQVVNCATDQLGTSWWSQQFLQLRLLIPNPDSYLYFQLRLPKPSPQVRLAYQISLLTSGNLFTDYITSLL